MATQYRALYLEGNKTFIENDSFSMTFLVLDEKNDIVSDLSDFKFACEISDGNYEVKKKDANYDDGDDSQISVSNGKITVNVSEDETDYFEGTFDIELQMINKNTGDKYTIYQDTLEFVEEVLDW